MSTSISLKSQYGTCTVEVDDDDMNLSKVIERLVEPVLCGSGYRREAIEEYYAVPESYVKVPRCIPQDKWDMAGIAEKVNP